MVSQLPLGVGSQTSLVKGLTAQINTRRKADIRIRFVDTEVSEVLQALSARTRANIVYAGGGGGSGGAAGAGAKRLISINVNASTTDEALRYITSAAGLAFRQIGNTYVVAPAGALKQAIEPLGEQARVPLTAMAVMDAAKMVTDAFPYVTVRPAGAQILLIGAPDDLQQAEAMLQGQDKSLIPDPASSEVVPLQNISPAQAVALMKSLYPELRAEAIGDEKRTGGTIGLAGPRSRVARARESLTTADAAPLPDRVFRIYNIKYSFSRVLRPFLQRAVPTVTVLAAPENYSPPRPPFNPITGATLGTASTSIGGNTAGSSTGSGNGSGTGGAGGAGSSGDILDTSAGVNEQTGQTAGGQAGSRVRVEPNDRVKTLVLSGPARDVDAAFALLEQIDTPPRQVLVEVKVVDVTPQFNDALGIQYGFPASVGFTNVSPGAVVDPATGAPTSSATVPFNSAVFSRLPLSFGAQINAVISHTNSKLLANPTIQVVDNDDASIFIGDTIRTQIAQSGIAGTTIQVLEFPVGIILLVRPRINTDGRITMRIHPVVSTITSIGAGNIPNTSNREAETTVMVNDGETIVIGGLIRDEFTKSLQEVPILSRLPLVGELFKFRSNNRRRSEVQVFITPHLNTTGVTMNAAQRNNAAATTVEQTHLSIPPPPRSGLPKDPHGELPQTRRP